MLFAFFPAYILLEAIGPAGFDQLLGADQPQLAIGDIALPAATIASRSIFTGAINELFDPMKAFSPITVSYLK